MILSAKQKHYFVFVCILFGDWWTKYLQCKPVGFITNDTFISFSLGVFHNINFQLYCQQQLPSTLVQMLLQETQNSMFIKLHFAWFCIMLITDCFFPTFPVSSIDWFRCLVEAFYDSLNSEFLYIFSVVHTDSRNDFIVYVNLIRSLFTSNSEHIPQNTFPIHNSITLIIYRFLLFSILF